MPTNLTTTNYERTYYSAAEQSDPPSWFRHASPTHPGSPSAPTYPGTLNSFERAEVERYLSNQTDAVLATLTLPVAITKANEYKTYYASAVIQAYLDADRAARKAQWQLFCADGVINSKQAIPPSGSDTGASGGTLPDPELPPGTNVP